MTTTTVKLAPGGQSMAATELPYRVQISIDEMGGTCGRHGSHSSADAATGGSTELARSEETAEITIHDLLLGWGMLQIYGEGRSQQGQDAVAGRTLPERLAALLVNMCNEKGRLDGVSLQAFAGCLGTERETVAAILRAFQRQDFLRLSYQQIEITDLPALKEFADIWQ